MQKIIFVAPGLKKAPMNESPHKWIEDKKLTTTTATMATSKPTPSPDRSSKKKGKDTHKPSHALKRKTAPVDA